MTTCPTCGVTFEPKRKHARFCSGRCRAEASLRRRIESAVRHADETFTPDPRFYRPSSPAWRLLAQKPVSTPSVQTLFQCNNTSDEDDRDECSLAVWAS